MTKNILTTLLILFIGTSNTYARNSVIELSVKDALANSSAQAKLDPAIKIYFKGQDTPEIIKNFGEYRTNKKTNAFNKSDKVACEWTFLSAMLTFQARAREFGANAIINVKSNYKNREFESATQYTCGAGNIIAGTAFIAEIAKTK